MKLTSEERELAGAAGRHARRQRHGRVHGLHGGRDLQPAARREGARRGAVGGRPHRPDRRERPDRRVVAAGHRSLRPRRAIPATPLQSCSASTRRDAPHRRGAPEPRGQAAQLEVSARGLASRRSPSCRRSSSPTSHRWRSRPARLARAAFRRRRPPARTMAVPMRTVDQVKYAKKLPDPFHLGVAERCRLLPADLRRRVQRGGPPLPRHRRPAARHREGGHQRLG